MSDCLNNITPLQLSDTFNTWFQRTNEIISEINSIEIASLSVYDHPSNHYFGQKITPINGSCHLTSEIITGPFINFQTGNSTYYGSGTSADPWKITLTFPNVSAFLADRQMTGDDELIINDSVSTSIPVKRIKAKDIVPSTIDVSYLRIQNRASQAQGSTFAFYTELSPYNGWSGISASNFSAERLQGFVPSTTAPSSNSGTYRQVIPVTDSSTGLIPDDFVRMPIKFKVGDQLVSGFDATADVKSFNISVSSRSSTAPGGEGALLIQATTGTDSDSGSLVANAVSYNIEALIPATGNSGPYGVNLFNINGYSSLHSALISDSRSRLSAHMGLSGGKGISTNLVARGITVNYVIPGDPANGFIAYSGMTAVDIFTIAENPLDSNYVRKIGDIMTGTLTGTSTSFVFGDGEILNTLTADTINNTTLFTGKNLKTTSGYAQFSLNPVGGTFTVNNNNTPSNHILQIVPANSTVSLNNGDHVFTDDNISLDKDGTGVVQIGYAGPQSGKSFFVNGDSQFDGNVQVYERLIADGGISVSGGISSDSIESMYILSSSLTAETIYAPTGFFDTSIVSSLTSDESYSHTGHIEFLTSATFIFEDATGPNLYSSTIKANSVTANNFYRTEATGGDAPNFNFNDNELITKALLDLFVPVGSVFAYAGNVLPSGYLWCDGQTYTFSPIEGDPNYKYYKLFQVIGVSYGFGGGSSFRVPDLRNIFAKGANQPNNRGQTGGNPANEIILTSENLPPHTHLLEGFADNDNSSYIRYLDGSSVYQGWPGVDAHGDEDAPGRDRGSLNHKPFSGTPMRPVASRNPDPTTDEDGMSSRPISISPPFVTINYIIKY